MYGNWRPPPLSTDRALTSGMIVNPPGGELNMENGISLSSFALEEGFVLGVRFGCTLPHPPFYSPPPGSSSCLLDGILLPLPVTSLPDHAIALSMMCSKIASSSRGDGSTSYLGYAVSQNEAAAIKTKTAPSHNHV